MLAHRAGAVLLAVALLTGCGPRPGTGSSPAPPGSSPATSPAAATSAPAPAGSPSPGRSTAPPPPAPVPSPPPSATADLGDPASLAVVVNKRRPLEPRGWAPRDLEQVEGRRLRPEAARAARELLAAARADGVRIVLVSGYRSYDEQAATYAGWVAQQGQAAADTASARPGHSEHQTGLAVDVGEGSGCDLQVCFADTAAAAWVADHAAEHGFVVRYPRGAQAVTGYWYEPWHLRYLGAQRARELVRSGAATLEEFSGLPPAPDYAPVR
ncbi:M15 family metallopeptidase [Kocuria sp. U4B]